MISRLHLSPLIGISISLWVIGLLVTGATFSVSAELLRPIGPVTVVMGLALTIFDKWGWKSPWLYPWFVDRPDLGGTWRATINSTYVEDGSTEPIGPIEAYVSIQQTYSDFWLRMMTAGSSSESIVTRVVSDGSGAHVVWVTYLNDPRQTTRLQSAIHYGTMKISVRSRRPTRMEGQYWTDRATTGDVLFEFVGSEPPSDFADAHAVFGTPEDFADSPGSVG